MNLKMKLPMIELAASPRLVRAATTALVALLATGGSGTLYAADMIKGGQLYTTHCAGCHGASGNGAMPGTPNFRQSNKLMQPDMMLLSTIRFGKNACPGFQGILRDNDIMDVISYLRTFN